ncbi:hypothetical protein COP2_035715 [Malus domestica]
MGFDLLVGFLHVDLFMGFLENNRLPLRKSFRACPSRGPVVIPNIDLVGYAYQFEKLWKLNGGKNLLSKAVLNLCRGVG